MDTLVWLFLESRIALAASLGTVLFVLLVHWRRGGRARPLQIGLALAVVLLVVQTLVVTQREHAWGALGEIERAVEESQTEPIAAELAPAFTAGRSGRDELDREGFLRMVRRLMQEVDVIRVQRTEFEITASEEDRFVVETTYFAEVSTRRFDGLVRSKWTFTFVRTPDGWRIGNIRPLEVGGVTEPTFRNISSY